MLALLVYPVALVKLQVSIQEMNLSHPLSFAGESTIWIQDDGLQVFHHHQERYDSFFIYNVKNPVWLLV